MSLNYKVPQGSEDEIAKKRRIDNNNDINVIRTNRLFQCLIVSFLIIFMFTTLLFAYLYFSLKKEIKNTKDNKDKDEFIYKGGSLASESNQTKNFGCSIGNCKECNACIECNTGFIPIYENNKIISCTKCNIGYHLINDECMLDYTFKAIYKSDESNMHLINYNASQIIEMTVDGQKVSPSYNYSFNDNLNHEISMLLDMSTNLNSTFKDIINIISISFNPLLNSSNITNMERMFYNCYSLTSIDFSNFDTSKVTKMSYMFYNCYSLTSIDLSNFDTLNVELMHFMFYNCYSLKSIDLSNFNTSQVANMNNFFYNCSSLTSIDLSNFNTSKVTDFGSMFKSCSSIEKINIANFNTKNLIYMDSMFCNCSSLTSIDLSSFDTSNMELNDYMFYNCSSLTSIDLSNFDTSKANIFDYIFYNCSSLTSIDLSNFDTSEVTHMDGMFYSCSRLQYINILKFSVSRLSTIVVNLFAQNIPLSGTIITNEDFINKINKEHISGWSINIS